VLPYLRRLCLAAETVVETDRLVAYLSSESRYTRTTASLRPKRRKASKL
jgi:hypothetical protein